MRCVHPVHRQQAQATAQNTAVACEMHCWRWRADLIVHNAQSVRSGQAQHGQQKVASLVHTPLVRRSGNAATAGWPPVGRQFLFCHRR